MQRIAWVLVIALAASWGAPAEPPKDTEVRDRIRSALQAVKRRTPADYPALTEEVRRLAPDTACAVRALRAILEEDCTWGQQHVPHVLVALDRNAAKPALFKAMQTPMPALRETAAEALLSLNDPDLLAQALALDTFAPARAFVAQNKDNPAALLPFLGHSEPLVRANMIAAVSSLPKRDAQITAALIQALENPDPGIRVLAAQALDHLRRDCPFPALRRALENEPADSPVRAYLDIVLFRDGLSYGHPVAAAVRRHKLIKQQVEPKHGEGPEFAYYLQLEGQKEPLFLAGCSGTGVSKHGFDEESLKFAWVQPEHLLQITWSTCRQGRGMFLAGSILLLEKVDDDWRLIYRHNGDGDEGSSSLGYYVSNTYHFNYNADSQKLQFRRTISHSNFGTGPCPSFADRDYTFIYKWPCRIANGTLQTGRGTLRVNLHGWEFTIDELARLLCRSQGTRENLERQKALLLKCNPQLANRSMCTGLVFGDLNLSPHEADHTDYRHMPGAGQ